MPKIKIDNLTYYYIDKKKKIGISPICNLNAVIDNNSFTIIIGESGSGKTTLLKLIAGIYKPNDGLIYFDNDDVTNLDAASRHLSYISQEFALYPHLTVFDNIAYPLKIAKVPADEIRIRVNEMLTLLDINLYQSRKPKQLSIGQRQRVAIARALIKKPNLILLDEPLSNLDDKLKAETIKLLKEIKEKFAITFVYVTHKLDEVKNIGTNLLILHNGSIVQSGTVDEVITDMKGYYYNNIAKYY